MFGEEESEASHGTITLFLLLKLPFVLMPDSRCRIPGGGGGGGEEMVTGGISTELSWGGGCCH